MKKVMINIKEKHLLMTLEYPPSCGGVGIYLQNLVENTTKYDFQILKSGEQNLCSGNVVELNFFYKKFWPKWLKAFFLLKKYKNNFSVLHISHILPLGYIALLAKKIWGKKYIIYLHGLDFNFMKKSKWKSYWGKKILKNASVVITNSKFLKKQIQAFFNIPVEVIYPVLKQNLLDFQSDKKLLEKVELLKKEYNIKDEDKVLLTMGRLVKRKGQTLVLEAIKNLDCKYFIIGFGPEEEKILELIKKYNLEKRVFLIDKMISPIDSASFYKLADIFIMPTLELGADVEGFGIVYLEANAFALPVIAGQGEGIKEAVINNQTGIILENPQDIKSIVKAIKDIEKMDFANLKNHYLKFLYEKDHLFNTINKYL